MAKPVTHKIDRFFGVGRARTWDPETLTLAGLFVATALIFAGAALVLAATQPKSGPTASARGAQILSVVVVVGILYALLSITRS